MIKYIFPLLLLIVSCKEAQNEQPSEVSLENQRLIAEANYKDSVISYYISSVNEIEENLSEIKQKENILSLDITSKESSSSKEDRILSDIELINELMVKNKKKISELEKHLKESKLQSKEFEKLIATLTKQIQDKDLEIGNLKAELIKVNSALAHLFSEYNNRLDELDQQTNLINAAFYAIGTAKELREKGVLTKEGGFIGIGKATKLMDDFNKSYFTQLDITQTPSIQLFSKNAKLITNHPKGSYQISSEGNKQVLIISDSIEFWSVSKYLVVVVD
ncbi:MAG: hypothetical protein H0V01_12375 [Bacteroidetes bacterium]|nr:hypothetical protein [Bacteroidota bacterium]HET6245856.1 hypothetical protein [Bacteroidia bacterium]